MGLLRQVGGCVMRFDFFLPVAHPNYLRVKHVKVRGYGVLYMHILH
jgi:hypothetical protein